jgi:DNA-binding CsgD family transcriptional regulator
LGFATWIEAGGSFELEDLFVDPDWRRREIAATLVARIAQVLRARGVERLERFDGAPRGEISTGGEWAGDNAVGKIRHWGSLPAAWGVLLGMAPAGLLDREGVLARLDGLLAAARAGRGGVLAVTGPAGIGKTVLVTEARERAGRAGMRVLAGRGGELEGGFSFGVVRQLFEPLLAGAGPAEREVLVAGAARRGLIALGDEAGTALPVAESERLFTVVHGLYWLVVNATKAGPVLVAVDDLHWADQASLRFLLYLADRLAGLPVALLLSWRAAEPGAGADRLARLEQAAAGGAVSLAPLSQEAVRSLLAGEFGAVPAGRFAAACGSVTGGNPFLLRELAASLRADGFGPGEEAAGQVAGLGPRSVARAVALRVARLGPAAGEVARAVAILGDGAQLRHAAALAGVGLADAAAAADELAGIGVFEPGTPLRFVHPIVRTAVHDDIPEAGRGLAHAEAARLLAADGADLDAVCAHLLVCEPAGSLEVVGRLRAAAARALGRGGAESAVSYLRRALAETADVGLRAGLLAELGWAEKVVGDPAAAGHLRESLRLASDPGTRAGIAPGLAELLLLAGQWDAGTAVVRSALADITGGDMQLGGPARAAVTRLRAWWAGLAAYDPHLVAEFDHSLGELRAAARGPDATSRMLAGLLAGVLAWRGERGAGVLALLDHALDQGRLIERVDSDPLMAAQALFAPVFLDELDRAAALADQLLALSRSRGSVLGLVIAASVRAAVQARRGELVGAETEVRAVIEIAVEHGMTFAVPSALYFAADALIERPELADVAALAGTIALAPDFARTASGAILREVKGRLALAQADFGTARAELQAAAGTYQALHLLNLGTCWRSALALAVAAADPGQARQLADSELTDARRAGLPPQAGIALRTRGMLEGGERGLRDLREAAEVLAACGMRLEHARALVELGAALRRAGQRTAARAPLRTGLDLAHRCGAVRLAQRARAELLTAGAKPRRAVLTGLEALTASERRVAELAAAGMSNPEIAQALFVTLSTVEGHLRHAYRKLSISSRAQLPDALRAAAPEPALPPDSQQKTTVPP